MYGHEGVVQHTHAIAGRHSHMYPSLSHMHTQVWQFTLSNVTFKLNATGTGSMKKAPEVSCDKMKIICVDQSLAQ